MASGIAFPLLSFGAPSIMLRTRSRRYETTRLLDRFGGEEQHNLIALIPQRVDLSFVTNVLSEPLATSFSPDCLR
jgi:hypothetical protein